MGPVYGRLTASAGRVGAEAAKPVVSYGLRLRPAVSLPESRMSEASRWPSATVGEGEAGVGRQRLLLTVDEGGGPVLAGDRKVRIEAGEFECAHQDSSLFRRGWGPLEATIHLTRRYLTRQMLWTWGHPV